MFCHGHGVDVNFGVVDVDLIGFCVKLSRAWQLTDRTSVL